MEIVATRIKWIKYLFLFVFLMFTAVDIWLIISILNSKGLNTSLSIMITLVSLISLTMLIITIINFIKNKNPVIIKDNKIIIKNIKEKAIEINDIKKIMYRTYRCSNRIFNFEYKSGNLIFILNNDKKIKVNDIKNVKETCIKIKGIVFKENN